MSVKKDPEELFELPPRYIGVKPLERAREASPDGWAFQYKRDILADRDHHRARHELTISALLTSPSLPATATSAMEGVDFTALDTQTPIQAALVEAALNNWSTEDSMIDLWGGVRGLAFALETFIEYCHAIGTDEAGFLIPTPGRAKPVILRLLEMIRTAPDREHAEVVAAAERLRQNEPSAVTRAVTTFLFPERPDWFWADLLAAEAGMLNPAALVAAVSTAEQASALGEQLRKLPAWEWKDNSAVELTFLTVAGAEALSFLLAWLDTGHRCGIPGWNRPDLCPVHPHSLDVIGRLPSDAAMATLVDRVGDKDVLETLQVAMMRFPRRAVRVLAEAEPAEETEALLVKLIRADPDLARGQVATFSPRALARVEALLRDLVPSPEPVELPEILASPPWRDKKRKRSKPVVVAGLTPPTDVKVAWLPGEREKWLAGRGAGWVPEQGWEAVWSGIRANPGNELLDTYFAAYGPEELVRSQLGEWQPKLRMATDRSKTFVAKYELLALPSVLPMARVPAMRAELLQPFVSAEIAAIMVDALARLRSTRGLATAWLRRHAEDAVRFLVPTALGKPGKVRQNTVAALRLLEADGLDVVAIGQRAYGEDVGTAIKEVLADRGFDAYPRTLPEVPLWARMTVLPEIRLKDGQTSLPHDAVLAVTEMLMFSKTDDPYPGLEVVKELCDARSLADFAWSVFEGWENAGAFANGLWGFGAVGLLGDDSTVARLQKVMRSWSKQSQADRAELGFDILATIGGGSALVTLHAFANMSWPNRLKRRAQARFDDVAQSMDLSGEQLADRLVPTLGLNDEGCLRLDYGPRWFEVSIDDLLRLVVKDANGTVLRALPKPGKRDDAELATAAYNRFTALKKETQGLVKKQVERLEQGMLGRRRWSVEEFAGQLVPHLLLGRLVRRLVWGVYDADSEPVGAFRIAEDGSFADVDDAHYEVPEGALVGVAHPADLGRDLERWSEIFADYEILQPFDQLGRPPLKLRDEDLVGKLLVRYHIYPDAQAGVHGIGELSNSPTLFATLLAAGWQPGPVGADRLWTQLLRPVSDGRYAVMELVPGLEPGEVARSGYQTIKAVWLSGTGDRPVFESHALPWVELDSVSASMILRDVER